jgi:hypothetical protein
MAVKIHMSSRKCKNKPISYWADKHYANGTSPAGLWSALDYGIYTDKLGIEHDFEEEANFYLKKKFFFDVVTLMLIDGRMRLAKNGQFLQGEIEEQVKLWSDAFPPSEESQADIGGIGTWFFMDECPAGVVLVYQLENGSEHLEWT